MPVNRKHYKWLYDNVVSRYYNFLIRWCFLPFGGRRRVRRELLRAASPQPGERILDMCCGTGGATKALAEMVGERSPIKAIDLSSGQVGVARERRPPLPNVDFVEMDASETSFRDGEFDRVVIAHALHEMPRERRLAVLREARRVLREGGALAVLELDRPRGLPLRLFVDLWWFYWLPFNIETPTRRDMLKHGVSEEVEEAGFTEVSKTSMYAGAFQVVRGRKPASSGPPGLARELAGKLAGPAVVLGVGNEMRGDDAFGILAARELRSKEIPDWLEVIEAGTVPENASGMVARKNPAVVLALDAADFGGEPGELRLLEPEELAWGLPGTHTPSLSLLAEYLKKRCGSRFLVLAAQPARTEFNSAPSREIRDAAVRAAEVIMRAVSMSAQ